MAETQRTPGKWAKNDTAFSQVARGHGARVFLVDDDLNEIAEIQGYDEANCQSNAQYIVLACNNFERMRELLKKVKTWINTDARLAPGGGYLMMEVSALLTEIGEG